MPIQLHIILRNNRKIVDLTIVCNIIKPIDLLGIKKEVTLNVFNDRFNRKKLYK